MSLTITPAQTPEDLEHIKQLFIEYQDWLNVDLCFQGFEAELKSLPGKYDCLLLARQNNQVCGCVGMWPEGEAGRCEMKRLYVRPAFQNDGVGRKLAQDIILKAQKHNYTKMCLDTLERLSPAIKLYESLGFNHCAPYYNNPLDHVVFMERLL